MVCVSEPENVAHMLNNDVLETTSGTHERNSALPGESNHIERRLHVSIRTGRRDENPTQTLYFSPPLPHFLRAHPPEGESIDRL